ncbi:MAG: hypothetical protein WC131_00845 [Bacilli bacterium]
MRKNKKMYAISLVFLGILTSFSSTYAYWQGLVDFSDNNGKGTIKIGNWGFGGISTPADNIPEYDPTTNAPNDSFVYFDGDYYVVRYSSSTTPGTSGPYGPYNIVSYEYVPNNTYTQGSVVYYNNDFYIALNGGGNVTGVSPDASAVNGWYNMTSINFKNNQAFRMNDFTIYNGVLYHTTEDSAYNNTAANPNVSGYWRIANTLEYSPYARYSTNEIVSYNGLYYKQNWGGPSVRGTPGVESSWSLVTLPTYSSGTTYSNGQIILYNSIPYQVTNSALTASRAPGSYPGVYKKLGTYVYSSNNSYEVGDVVLYDGKYYKAVNKQRAQDNVPGTVNNSWNLLNTAEYQPLNTYKVGDYVMYQGNAYYVYNETNANLHAPNTYESAWNVYGTLTYNKYTVYGLNTYVGDSYTKTVVVYNGVAYVARMQSVNKTPPTRPATSNTYWEEYTP